LDGSKPACVASLPALSTVSFSASWRSVSLVQVAGTEAAYTFTLSTPELWWPNGYGQQPQYRLAATLESDRETVYDRRELRLGLRRLRLVQEPLAEEPGTSFLFEVNNIPIFCGGANWIPSDSFTPRVSAERYRAQIQQAADAHMVMLRVWGGGIYEEDVFYDLCDELGLLVWQDFMFACGMYPDLDWFQASVRAEAEAAVKRLRHHACLALWCGNNEDYAIAESIHASHLPFDGDFTAMRFPARAIYEQLLPEVCGALDPTRTYWPGSPYGGAHSADPTVGDVHVWGVWHGAMAPYQQYPRLAGRFVSEFGMQALPERAMIESFAPPAERYAESRTLEHHNKAADGPRRLAVNQSDTTPAPADLDGYIYASQLVQAEALGAAYRGWRRRWAGHGHQAVAGALVWQLNDCWPVTSWAIVDYALRPKPAYYVVRRELAPLVVGLAHAAEAAEVWVASSATRPVEAVLELRAFTFDGQVVAEERRRVALPANQATELDRFGLDKHQALVLGARLLRDGKVVARAALWPEPFKYFMPPDPQIETDRLEGDELALRAVRPAKGVLLAAVGDVAWSDNFLDLLPGDEQIVAARGLGDAPLRIRWLR
jgi:beta-mannosidase